MNLLFLTLVQINSLQERGIYQDLLSKFRDNGHNVFVVCPNERRNKSTTQIIKKDGINILQVKTLNIQKANFIEKGIGTLALEYQFLKSIKVFFKEVKFDIVLYSTPPITLVKVIKFIKNRDNAMTYLLLKDIFPQNAIDLKLLRENGLLHKYFVNKERQLYQVSDYIGCMSQANLDYILSHNKGIEKFKVEVNPNSIEPTYTSKSICEKNSIREKYNLPLDKYIFIYGGNLGKPQGLDFLLNVIEKSKNKLCFFVIVGNGTEYEKISNWFSSKKPKNAKLFNSLPKEDYDRLVKNCDVGLIFLDKKFTIPNFPSRLLSYLEMKLPVISATDEVSDIGDILEENHCGLKVISGDLEGMESAIDKIISCNDFDKMGESSWKLLVNKFNVSISYGLILEKYNMWKNV